MRFISSLRLSFFPFVFLFPCYYLLVLSFEACPNKEFLTWDPEIRFLISLQWIQYIQDYRLDLVIWEFLQSPHWPRVRNLIQVAVFLVNGAPDPVLDQWTTFSVFLLTIWVGMATIRFLGWADKGFLLLLQIVFGVGMLQSYPLLVYAWSGMMETFGGLALLGSILLFFAYQSSPPEKQNKGWYLLFSALLLHQTKYPYGYISLVVVLGYFLILRYYESIPTLRFLLPLYFQTLLKRKTFYFAILVQVAFLLAKIGFAESLSAKFPKQWLHASVLALVADVPVFFLKTIRESQKLVYPLPGLSVWKDIYLWYCLPILGWMLLNPDRFGSIGGQVVHVQIEGGAPGVVPPKDFYYYFVFFIEHAFRGFYSLEWGWITLFLPILVMVHGLIRLWKTKSNDERNRITTDFSFFVPIISLGAFCF